MPEVSTFAPPTGRSIGRTVVVLVVSLVLICGVVVAVGWLITDPLHGTFVHENAVNRWFVDQRTTDLTQVADVGTLVGQTVTGLVVLTLLGVGFGVWQRTWWPVVFVGVLDAGMGLFYLAGTEIDARRRPPVHILQSGLVENHSFPSGHTATATAIAGALVALLHAYTRVSRALLVVLVVVPVFTMLSRLYVGAHHVSDVLTAFVYAAAWTVVCAVTLLPPRDADGWRKQAPEATYRGRSEGKRGEIPSR
jgi:membrane-associated phospholipid phosphatase